MQSRAEGENVVHNPTGMSWNSYRYCRGSHFSFGNLQGKFICDVTAWMGGSGVMRGML